MLLSGSFFLFFLSACPSGLISPALYTIKLVLQAASSESNLTFSVKDLSTQQRMAVGEPFCVSSLIEFA